MLKTVPVVFIFVCICNRLLFGSVDSYDINNRDYLAKAKIIHFARMDSLYTFNGDLPQGYYIQLFMTALAMGVNGYTRYEVIGENSTVLRTQRYLLAGYTCESPEKCFAQEIVKELGEYEPESHRVYTCFGKNRKKGRKRKK